MIGDLDRARNSLLDGSPEVVAGAGGDVSDPSGDDRPPAPRPDEDVEKHVRNRSDERELAALLANELVPRGEGHESFEPRAHEDRDSVPNVEGQRFGKRELLGQRLPSPPDGLAFLEKGLEPLYHVFGRRVFPAIQRLDTREQVKA